MGTTILSPAAADTALAHFKVVAWEFLWGKGPAVRPSAQTVPASRPNSFNITPSKLTWQTCVFSPGWAVEAAEQQPTDPHIHGIPYGGPGKIYPRNSPAFVNRYGEGYGSTDEPLPFFAEAADYFSNMNACFSLRR